MAFFRGHLSVFRLLMWPFISKRHNCKQWRNTLQTYRSAKKLYTITYVAFYQLKQPQHIFDAKEKTNSTFDGECVCYIWWKYNTWSPASESHWLTSTAAGTEPARSTHKGHTTTILRRPSDRVTQWGRNLSYRIWEFLRQPALNCEPQEPDIKVALLNRFHSPAPEEWIHFLALINTLVSSNMYVTLGGWQYKFVIPLIKGSLIKFKRS